jgi:hypothetical protein
MDGTERLLYHRTRCWAHAHSPFACPVVRDSDSLLLLVSASCMYFYLIGRCIAMISLQCINSCTSMSSSLSSDGLHLPAIVCTIPTLAVNYLHVVNKSNPFLLTFLKMFL